LGIPISLDSKSQLGKKLANNLQNSYLQGVNPFDQPGVEAYKKNMFALLEKPGFEDETKAIKYSVSNKKTFIFIKIIQTFEMGSMLLAEINISKKHKWLNQEIKDIIIPRNLVVVSILRNDEVIYPKGDTLLHEEDKVVFVCDKETISGLKKYL